MSNDLINNNDKNNSLEGFNLEQEQQLEILLHQKIKAMSNTILKLEKITKSQQVEIQQNTIDISTVRGDLAKQYDKISHAQNDLIFNYVGLSALGASHSPPIGSQHMGKLLRLVEICKKANRTEPLSEYTRGNEPIAKTLIINGYSSWVFHNRKTWDLIKKKLNDKGILNDFEQWSKKDDLHNFINMLDGETK